MISKYFSQSARRFSATNLAESTSSIHGDSKSTTSLLLDFRENYGIGNATKHWHVLLESVGKVEGSLSKLGRSVDLADDTLSDRLENGSW